jgi:hypothetical protein
LLDENGWLTAMFGATQDITDLRRVQRADFACQRKIEMSPSLQSRNVPISLNGLGVHANLLVPVKRRRAMLASNPIKE